jgi:type IV pilus assembly protein PilF
MLSMTNKWRMGSVMRSFLMWSCLCLTLACGVMGCSSTNTSSNTRSDIVTDSDEPENRKRARIRLQLAVGYYSNGQTTIALDELKQSISADPTLSDAYNLRGLIYTRLNNVPLAEESFRRALSISPNAPGVQHNYALLLCQQSRYPEAIQLFSSALSNPEYGDRARTWMAQGGCELNHGKTVEAEASFLRSYELDASNPITGYNLALLMFQRQEYVRAQFYVRRINNSELANAESLWLGVKVERKLGNRDAAAQLGTQLAKRFSSSREATALERSAFDE